MKKWKGRKQERNSEREVDKQRRETSSTLEFYLGNVLFLLKKQDFFFFRKNKVKGSGLWLWFSSLHSNYSDSRQPKRRGDDNYNHELQPWGVCTPQVDVIPGKSTSYLMFLTLFGIRRWFSHDTDKGLRRSQGCHTGKHISESIWVLQRYVQTKPTEKKQLSFSSKISKLSF